ncbi:MAG: hypothetical protein ACKPEA_12330 [Planctomycetota bacterium]
MTTPATRARIDEQVQMAEAALRRAKWFEAERCALKGLEMARRAEEFELMASICLPLQEARRQRLQLALDAKKITVLSEGVVEEMKVHPGCYIVEPPLVGADARRLRLAALRDEVPVAVLCREPINRMGQCPIVAIGGVTVRTRIPPAKNHEKPTLSWFANALEELGNFAIETVDAGHDLDKQIDDVLAKLDAHPDHEGLHQTLMEICQEAAKGFTRSQESADPFEDELDADDESE